MVQTSLVESHYHTIIPKRFLSSAYHIQPNYCIVYSIFLVKYLSNTGTLKRKISRELSEVKGIFNDTYAFFSAFLYKSLCYWYSFELPQLVEAIQMSTNNVQFYKEVAKITWAVRFLDHVLTGTCEVIRSNKLIITCNVSKKY